MTWVEKAAAAYREHFGAKPSAGAAAPGRVEIIGNHTDYNGGFVLPAALDLSTIVLGEPTNGETITLFAADFDQEASVSLLTLEKQTENSWANYLLGVVDQLRKAGVQIGGFRALIQSEVPTGAGVSSSASLEVATAFFLQQLFPYEQMSMQTAQMCQRAENEFVGVSSGLMDQFASVFGREDSFLFLDCLTLEHDTVRMGREDIAIVICNSGVTHALTGGDYNTRRAECMAAAAHFGKTLLRDVDWDEFAARELELPLNERKRARHILTENQRVLEMCDAVRRGDTNWMRDILASGHASCRDLFENSTPELDFLVDNALSLEGCFGARMTGGGWGGCTVNLVHIDAVNHFTEQLAARYRERLGREAVLYTCRASEGAHVLSMKEYH